MSRLLVAQRALTVPGWAKDALWRNARAVPSLDLRFADNKSLVDAVTGASLITFTRASSGTFVDSAGVLQTAATDVPRFDHNPTTGESLGLLVEEQRTNLLLRSEEFDNASWTKVGVTVTANSIASPTGALTADKLVESSTNDAHRVEGGATFAASSSYSTSFYAKAAERNIVFTRNFFPGQGSYNCAFDLSNGTVQFNGLGQTGAITDVGNGWYRCSVTASTTSAGAGGIRIGVAATAITSDANPTYLGDGTSGIYLWGAQLEAGAFPSSYIPTTTAAATRSADVASITGTAFSGWYRQDEGTVFAEYSNQATAGSDRRIFNTSDATGFTTNGSTLFLSNGAQGAASFNTFVGGANIGVLHSSTPLVVGVVRKAAYSIQVNLRVLVVGGAAPLISSNSYTPPSNIVTADLGQTGGIAPVNGHIRRLTYWPQALPSRLQALTQ